MNATTEADREFTRLGALFAEAVKPYIEPGQDFALLDFPDHDNIGDSAIWIGQLAFFDRHVGRRPRVVCTDKEDPAATRDYLPEGPVFLQGGGNFGDLWPHHHRFRLRALERLRGRPIVQLPQSLHFRSDAARDETARAIARHGAFTLLVRDRFSYDFAREHFDCDVKMAPDAAVNIHHIGSRPPTKPIKSLLRKDKESVWKGAHDVVAEYGEVIDWPRNLSDRIARKLLSLGPLTRLTSMRHRQAMFRLHAQTRLDTGVAALEEGACIVSDRLHAHLIASLMRRPQILLDNSYGKIGRHIDAWSDFGLARRVSDMDALRAALAENAGTRT
ncbi:Putative pyruvyl transferase EpsO [Jannaschia seosinensis]|uniref:Putative pyruvyl transferase EpsO n=1 Tax=Jannaschia seosinensis TaxID=313367 RepID=A0A0M7B7L1_9RHOB|nr:polysaccharide pyruvyl transferase family protein [Jannaschia seosinensis]CUH07538.1 Putative pyruvyl transferase EpsO [Jannaschia seosinensis]